MFGFGKKPVQPVEEVKPQSGAAAFIAGVENDVAGFEETRRAYVEARVAQVETLLRTLMAAADANPIFHTIVDNAKQAAGVAEHDPALVLFEDVAGIAAMALAKIYADENRSVPNICQWAEHVATIFWQQSMINNGHATRI